MGSTFRVSVPVNTEIHPQRVTSFTLPTASELNFCSVLMLDDDPTILNIVTRYLENYNVIVRTTTTMDGAIDLVRKEIFDVILLDYNLSSDLTGLDVVNQLFPYINTETTHLVMLTADATEETKQKVRARGLYLLHKPITQQGLIYGLKQIIGDMELASSIQGSHKDRM